MWSRFEGKARTREETLARINELRWTDWKPQGITLHNTAAPNLKQWAETGPAHDARIRNLQSYYENDLGWHSGPHFFVSRNWINWFSNPLAPGVHSRCWNATRFGIEMVGDFAVEEFNSGDGELVRDNAVFLMAALNNKFGFKADDLTFHKECNRDNHDCPGRKVIKADVILLVKQQMAALARPTATPAPVPTASVPKVLFRAEGKMSTFGGPKDTGMSPDEGLALFNDADEMARHLGASYVLSIEHAGAPGLGRRLNPTKFYVACRWPYDTTSKAFLRDAVAWVENPKTGKKLDARPVDWGPNERTSRVADLSPGLAQALELRTDDVCIVTVHEGELATA